MRGRSKASIALVAVLLFAVPASAGAAATRTVVDKPTITSSFSLRASNRYWVEIEATRAKGEKQAKVTVRAVRERYKAELVSTAYSIRAPLRPDGSFDAKFPGLGRIDVGFDQAKLHKVRVLGGADCTDLPQVFRKGSFRGTISFRGEGGFTQVEAKGAPGLVREDGRQVCHIPVSFGPPPEEPPGFRDAVLYASGQSAAGAVTFSAAGPPATEPPTSSGGIPTVAFEGTYSTERRGIRVLARAVRNTEADFFKVPGAVGALTDASADPPAPFSGTGAYHLESPTTASWTGDLSVELPGIGTVPLTGPDFSARLCEGASPCSGAPPPAGPPGT